MDIVSSDVYRYDIGDLLLYNDEPSIIIERGLVCDFIGQEDIIRYKIYFIIGGYCGFIKERHIYELIERGMVVCEGKRK